MEYIIKYDGKEKISSLMWIGLLIYSVGLQLSLAFNGLLYSRILYMFGILLVIIPLIAYMNVKSVFRLNIIYTVLILLCITMYVRSGAKNYFSLYSYGAISYIAFILPAVLILPFIKSAFKIGRIVNVFFVLTFWVPLSFSMDTGFIQSYLESYAMFAAFMFLTNKYHDKKDIYLSLAVIILAFLVATLTARRNLMLTFALYLMFGSFFFVFNGKLKSLEVKIIAILSSFLLLFCVYYFYMNERTGAFSKITSRASENTREEVFTAFAVDMFNAKDLMIGRGMYGTYYNPGVDIDSETGESNDDRGNIECGYLQCILKGGMIYLFLYVSLFVFAISRGFKSKNQFSKGGAIILLVQLVDMFPFGLHDFNTKTFIIWTAVALCMNTKLREMSDEEIKLQIYKKKNMLLSWQRK